MQIVQSSESVLDNSYAMPTEYINNLIRKHFDQRWEDIAGEEFEVSGDYSMKILATMYLL